QRDHADRRPERGRDRADGRRAQHRDALDPPQLPALLGVEVVDRVALARDRDRARAPPEVPHGELLDDAAALRHAAMLTHILRLVGGTMSTTPRAVVPAPSA